MFQRTGLIIAVILTAFVLVVGGAIVGRRTQPEKPPAETAAVQVLMERETAYQDLARQANERLQQAYANLQAQAQAHAQAQATAASPAVVFSPEQAANIALQVAPGAVLMGIPVLVNFQEALAYKVSLSTGVVYVDANSGQVVYNGIMTLPSSGVTNRGLAKSDKNGDKGGGSERDGGEHESGSSDD